VSEESMKARGSENKNEWGTVFRDREHPSVCHHESSVTSTHTRGQCTSRERERERERERDLCSLRLRMRLLLFSL